MHLVIGLGNPGLRYAKTRHNLGFVVVDRLAAESSSRIRDRGMLSRYGKVRIAGGDAVLAKPQTYMNRSGEAAAKLIRHFAVDLAQVIVIHDDLDLAVGVVRIKSGGGSGGHNGLTSIIDTLSSAEFTRVRLGIGRPPGGSDAADYVLERFRRDEVDLADTAVMTASRAVVEIISSGLDTAMNLFNRA